MHYQQRTMSSRVIWDLTSHVTMYDCVLDFYIKDPFRIGVFVLWYVVLLALLFWIGTFQLVQRKIKQMMY